jgi:protein-S-isoprenylcysteine O-methyltransferase Ste14
MPPGAQLQSPDDHAHVIMLPPFLFLICVGLGGVLHYLVWTVPLAPALPVRIAGGIFLIAGGALASWGVQTMRRAGTNVRPDRPTLSIVTTGPYCLTRNPMYVAMCVVFLGVALLINGVAPLLCFPPLVLALHFGVIKREERYLVAKFGAPYLEYQRSVRRWL